MKRIYNILTAFTLVLILTSCERDLETEGLSRITYFPTFEMAGEQEVFQSVGSTYTDPGVKVTEEGKEIQFQTTVSGTYFNSQVPQVNTAVPDVYTITYSAVNKDGFPGSTSRTVYVAGKGDLVNSIEGIYTSTVVRNGAAAAQYTDMPYVIIAKTGTNTYELSDYIGGYYDLGRAYGPGYAAYGATITANNIASNNFSFATPFTVGGFGGEGKIKSFNVDPTTKTIKLVTEWSTFTFDITLTQVEF